MRMPYGFASVTKKESAVTPANMAICCRGRRLVISQINTMHKINRPAEKLACKFTHAKNNAGSSQMVFELFSKKASSSHSNMATKNTVNSCGLMPKNSTVGMNPKNTGMANNQNGWPGFLIMKKDAV